ncbi:hypothetical protein MHYP_G00166830 [Metynnis hypsauchen]
MLFHCKRRAALRRPPDLRYNCKQIMVLMGIEMSHPSEAVCRPAPDSSMIPARPLKSHPESPGKWCHCSRLHTIKYMHVAVSDSLTLQARFLVEIRV